MLKLPKQPNDKSRITRRVVSETARNENIIEPPTRAQISFHMAQLGRKGGKKGGKRRLETMTSQERIEIAKKAARARWKSS
jgi:hypothetical protein